LCPEIIVNYPVPLLSGNQATTGFIAYAIAKQYDQRIMLFPCGSYAMKRFMEINFLEEDVSGAMTLLKFRHLPEEHDGQKRYWIK
jgi:hypothetical protein